MLIFSQFTTTLDILASYFSLVGYGYYRIDGNTDQATRQQYIDAFHGGQPASQPRRRRGKGHDNEEEHEEGDENEEGDAPVQLFLLTTPSGGVGINLQAANTVILFDQDWNPQQDLQAISRAHRLGQRDPVLVLRLISTGPDGQTASIEEMMWEKALRKLQANHTILKKGVFATASRGRLMMPLMMMDNRTGGDAQGEDDGSSSSSSGRQRIDINSHENEDDNEGDDGNNSEVEETDELTTLEDPLSLTLEDDQTLTGSSGGSVDREDAMARLAENELPFQWQSLFMQKEEPLVSSSSGVQGQLSKHQQQRQPQPQPPSLLRPPIPPNVGSAGGGAAVVNEATVAMPSPCCRLRWTMALPSSSLDARRHQASLTNGSTVQRPHATREAFDDEDDDDGTDDNGDNDVWATICDRRRDQRLPTSQRTSSRDTATTTVTLQDDDFIEITLLPPSPRQSTSGASATAAASVASSSIWSPLPRIFASQLTTYRRYLLPHLTTTASPVRSPTKSSTGATTTGVSTPATASAGTTSPQRRSARTHAARSHFHRFQHAHYQAYHDSPDSHKSLESNTSPSRRRRRRRSSRRHGDEEDHDDTYVSNDHSDSDSDCSSPRKRPRRHAGSQRPTGRRGRRGRQRQPQRRRATTGHGDDGHGDDNDDVDENDICVLCHQAALDESEYRALRAAIISTNDDDDNDDDGARVDGDDHENHHAFDPSLLETLLLCDGCDGAYHLVCVGLTQAPEDDWYCALCESAPLFDAEIPSATPQGDSGSPVIVVDDVVEEEEDNNNNNDDDDHDEEIVSVEASESVEEYDEESYRLEDDEEDHLGIDEDEDEEDDEDYETDG